MSMEIVLEGKLEKEKDRESVTAFLQQICERHKIKSEDYDTLLMIEVCPEGSIECSYEGCFVSIAAQTNVAGPGFHAFVCRLFDDIIQEAPIHFEVSDPTGYYTTRNFETLKYQYFYRWLADIKDYVKEQADDSEITLCWPVNDYRPKKKDGYVVTPMGYLSKRDFKERDCEDLAKDFFIWNDIERTAHYYRNCALSLLWKECFYAYSNMNETTDKIGNSIVDYLEAAYEKDNLLPLPLKAYEEVCAALHREVLIHHGEDMGLSHIGYRKELISYYLGNWSIPVHGCCEKSYDASTQSLHFMAPYKEADEPWHWMIKANAYSFEQPVCDFLEALRHPKTDEEGFSFEKEDLHMMGVIRQEEAYFTMQVQVNCEHDTLFLECVIKEKADVELLRGWFEGIVHHQIETEDVLPS